MYNLVKRQAEVDLLPMAQSEKLGVISYSPSGAGLLSGKYLPGQGSSPGRLDSDKMYKSRYREPWMHDTAKRFHDFSTQQGFNPVSLAIAWVAHHPAVTAPIIGARNIEQLDDSLNAINIEMTPELYAQVSELSPKPSPANDRSEKI